LRIPSRSIRDYSTFPVHRNFKTGPSAKCVSAANAVCRDITIFNKAFRSRILVSLLFVFIFIDFCFSLFFEFYILCLSVIDHLDVVKLGRKLIVFNYFV
jgi:hypothetical protein